MNKLNYVADCEAKIAELKSSIAALKIANVDDPNAAGYISKNTRTTQLYAKGRERRTLHLIMSLLSQLKDVSLDGDDLDTFLLLTKSEAEKAVGTGIAVKEGDDIMQLIMAHENLNKKKLEAKCEKLGLRCNYATGKIVKA